METAWVEQISDGLMSFSNMFSCYSVHCERETCAEMFIPKGRNARPEGMHGLPGGFARGNPLGIFAPASDPIGLRLARRPARDPHPRNAHKSSERLFLLQSLVARCKANKRVQVQWPRFGQLQKL